MYITNVNVYLVQPDKWYSLLGIKNIYHSVILHSNFYHASIIYENQMLTGFSGYGIKQIVS